MSVHPDSGSRATDAHGRQTPASTSSCYASETDRAGRDAAVERACSPGRWGEHDVPVLLRFLATAPPVLRLWVAVA
ncbi:MAG TPA: hypothetical protein VHH91_01620, partial [Vicinamibacterales bacterium]|nr:hypothetical protein [Vicinamibacterales bacterium]